jgi:hypothetical protein
MMKVLNCFLGCACECLEVEGEICMVPKECFRNYGKRKEPYTNLKDIGKFGAKLVSFKSPVSRFSEGQAH